MYIGSINEVPMDDVSKVIPGTRGFYIQWLVTRDKGSYAYAVRRFIVKPGGRMPLHSHKYTEAVVLLKGRLRVRIGDVTRELGPGDFFFTAQYEPHALENIGDSDAEFICVISYEDDMSVKVLEK